MILMLNEAPLHGVAGIARYRPEFSAAPLYDAVPAMGDIIASIPSFAHHSPD